jgi:uncharacterized protein YqgC (DUF456 family)
MLTQKALLSWLMALTMFRLGFIATGGRMIPSCNFSFAKRTMVGWMRESSNDRKWMVYVGQFP